jgi:arabinofuranosyltransferase
MLSRNKSIRAHKFSIRNYAVREVKVTSAAGIICFDLDRDIYILDIGALCDPLLARLPYIMRRNHRIGHYLRGIPKGYKETLINGKNLIHDKKIAEYYDKVKIITQGSIFSIERFKVIYNMNIGNYSYLLK